MPSRHRLQQYAIAVSIFSVFYNAAEGIVSVVFGAESSSRALVFYGLQSAVEVISDGLVTWRFLSVIKSGDDLESKTSPKIVRIERIATIIIGASLLALTVAGVATSGTSLAAHDHPSTTLPSIIIAATSTGFTFFLYLMKRYLARALDSSALHGEALCALCCMELSIVLLIGSLIFRVWKGGWWVDSVTAIVISLMFGWEGFKMIRWARKDEFDGGCCAKASDKAAHTPTTGSATPSVEMEKPKESGSEQKEGPSFTVTSCCGCSKRNGPVDGVQAC
ncbi:hypothetical protein JVU11DRAFT_1171 [Chiua virens]|nr:hypothetical protein JVU11DRAFT_10251 [Chiua virens]KAG9316991.1 hypothetical protein JVU11DRAFT_1171 [Chiua virens]